ncbi:MAG TPA: L,D-transpeptidase [Polyangiaceae bacterium]
MRFFRLSIIVELALAAVLGAVLGCGKRAEPPGALAAAGGANAVEGRVVGSAVATEVADLPSTGVSAPLKAAAAGSAEPGGGGSLDIGTPLDNLPFDEQGPDVVQLGSIAWRTWIYTDTGPTRTRYGYLRAGAIVAARGPKLVNEGCDGDKRSEGTEAGRRGRGPADRRDSGPADKRDAGWYRVNPRGFVCLGLGATKDLSHPVIVASRKRALRGQGLPYAYALSSDTPPLLYFRLPSAKQMEESEGGDFTLRAANHRERIRASGVLAALGEIGAPPDFLGGDAKLPKPYGVKQPLRYVSHAGAAAADSGFAIASSFDWEKRLFGLTTELDVIALDRVKLVKQSALRGVEIAENEGLPVAFSKERYGQRYVRNAAGLFEAGTQLSDREGVKLTGQSKPGGFLETRDGTWVAEASMRVLPPRDTYPSFATGDRKWLDISIKQQSLVAYMGKTAVYAALISSGRAGLGDPDETESTPRGTFMIYQKEVASTMDGDEDKGDSYNLRDVPFVQYFHKGYALHGAYWHDDFGKVRSHGCVNLAPLDAAWLFEWTDPSVPATWHGVLNKERGTVVYIHP